jgi:hypothetical protein
VPTRRPYPQQQDLFRATAHMRCPCPQQASVPKCQAPVPTSHVSVPLTCLHPQLKDRSCLPRQRVQRAAAAQTSGYGACSSTWVTRDARSSFDSEQEDFMPYHTMLEDRAAATIKTSRRSAAPTRDKSRARPKPLHGVRMPSVWQPRPPLPMVHPSYTSVPPASTKAVVMTLRCPDLRQICLMIRQQTSQAGSSSTKTQHSSGPGALRLVRYLRISHIN